MTSPRLLVTDEIFAAFPEAVLGVITAQGIDNSGSGDDAILGPLRQEEERIRATLAGVQLSAHPHIAPWREAYRKFGARPKDHPSSIENLVRRVLKGWTVPHINPLVDLYNTISLRHLLPVGGEDLDRIEGDVRLTLATADEAPVHLLGEAEARPPEPGEVIYRDELGTLCRRWNWKEADRTKLTESTRDGFLVVEALPPVMRAELVAALADLAEMVRSHCGGVVRTAILDATHLETPLEGA